MLLLHGVEEYSLSCDARETLMDLSWSCDIFSHFKSPYIFRAVATWSRRDARFVVIRISSTCLTRNICDSVKKNTIACLSVVVNSSFYSRPNCINPYNMQAILLKDRGFFWMHIREISFVRGMQVSTAHRGRPSGCGTQNSLLPMLLQQHSFAAYPVWEFTQKAACTMSDGHILWASYAEMFPRDNRHG